MAARKGKKSFKTDTTQHTAPHIQYIANFPTRKFGKTRKRQQPPETCAESHQSMKSAAAVATAQFHKNQHWNIVGQAGACSRKTDIPENKGREGNNTKILLKVFYEISWESGEQQWQKPTFFARIISTTVCRDYSFPYS